MTIREARWNEAELQACRDMSRCQMCGERRPCEPHHPLTVGSGRVDLFCIGICRPCHNGIHSTAGGRAFTILCLTIAGRSWGKTWQEVEHEIHWLRRQTNLEAEYVPFQGDRE